MPSTLPPLSLQASSDLIEKMVSKSRILDPSLQSLTTEIEHLPSSSPLSSLLSHTTFAKESKEMASSVFLNDLLLARTVIYPRSTHLQVEYDNGTYESHQSTVSSSLWTGEKTFKGVSSWLYDQWKANKNVEDYTDVESSGYSSSDLSETETTRGSVRSSLKGSQKGKSKRHSRIRSVESAPSSIMSSQRPGQGSEGIGVGSSTHIADIATRLSQRPSLILSQSSRTRPSQASQTAQKRKRGF